MYLHIIVNQESYISCKKMTHKSIPKRGFKSDRNCWKGIVMNFMVDTDQKLVTKGGF